MSIPGTKESNIWTINTDRLNHTTVKWEKLGSEFSYSIWYSKNPNGPWIRHNDIRLTDDIIDILNYEESLSYNEYLIDGLEANTKYSIKVTCNDRYDGWWYSFSAYNSIEGGAGSSQTTPTANNGNIVGLQFYVNV